MAAAKSHFQLQITILVMFLTLSFMALTIASKPTTSPFGFLNHLKGCHKGQKLKGIKQLKNYLEKFGYLHYDHSNKSSHNHLGDNDDFDELLEVAVKTYQKNFHIRSTGVLDSQTVSVMSTPRCGCPDIVNGTNTMDRSNHGRHLGSFKTVAHFRFFPGRQRWPAGRTRLTYGFDSSVPRPFSRIVARAYEKWAAATHFTFTKVDVSIADMKVGIHGQIVGRNDDPFDGPGGVVGHAWAPTDGRAHYDRDENWRDGAFPGTTDVETVALHEIGHQLGLDHSEVPGAIMAPSFLIGTRRALQEDDIQGIKVLYGV